MVQGKDWIVRAKIFTHRNFTRHYYLALVPIFYRPVFYFPFLWYVRAVGSKDMSKSQAPKNLHSAARFWMSCWQGYDGLIRGPQIFSYTYQILRRNLLKIKIRIYKAPNPYWACSLPCTECKYLRDIHQRKYTVNLDGKRNVQCQASLLPWRVGAASVCWFLPTWIVPAGKTAPENK